MNNVNLLGRTVREIDVKYTANEVAVAKFTLAVNGFKKDETNFINCIAFNKNAENIAKYVGKGNQVGISGSIKTGSYTKEDGTRVYTTDVIVDRFHLVEKKQEDQLEQSNYDMESDDLPF